MSVSTPARLLVTPFRSCRNIGADDVHCSADAVSPQVDSFRLATLTFHVITQCVHCQSSMEACATKAQRKELAKRPLTCIFHRITYFTHFLILNISRSVGAKRFGSS
jgi:hypothetical protein